MDLSGFERFSSVILRDGVSAVISSDTIVADSLPYTLYYMPFEHVAREARLVIVGITPGPNQLEIAYASVQRQLMAGATAVEILAGVKSQAAFGGEAMRPNLLRMLRHFRFARILGIADEEELWSTQAHLLHATSVVPHAAFKAGRMFAGSFREVMHSPVLRQCFEDGFVAPCADLPDDALYLGLGPTPLEALRHCVRIGAIRESQLLGALAHPSRNSGSQVGIYLHEKTPDDLKPGDPVRARVPWLREAYGQVRANTARLGGGPASPGPAPAPDASAVRPKAVRPAPATPPSGARRRVPPTQAGSPPEGLHFVVQRGKAAGTVLYPHIQDGYYTVSPTRFAADYIRVPQGQSVEPYLQRGLGLRMSAPGVAASLIMPGSILGRRKEGGPG